MQPPAPNAPTTPRILIADDNAQNVELLEAYLAAGDWDVRTAADGEETLCLVRDWQPDVILLDIMMPKISGFEVCKRLRANPGRRGTGWLTARLVLRLMIPGRNGAGRCLGQVRGLPVRSGDSARETGRFSLDAVDPFGGGQRVWVVRAELAPQMGQHI